MPYSLRLGISVGGLKWYRKYLGNRPGFFVNTTKYIGGPARERSLVQWLRYVADSSWVKRIRVNVINREICPGYQWRPYEWISIYSLVNEVRECRHFGHEKFIEYWAFKASLSEQNRPIRIEGAPLFIVERRKPYSGVLRGLKIDLSQEACRCKLFNSLVWRTMLLALANRCKKWSFVVGSSAFLTGQSVCSLGF